MMRNPTLLRDTLYWSVTLLLAIFMSYQVYLTTIWGAGLTTDSVTYLEGARSILANGNLEKIGTHYPPLYFVLIALGALITGDALVALRWLQVVTIFLNTILFSYVAWKGTYRTLIPTIICTLLFATSMSVLSVHTKAWSEASFCLLALLGFYFLANYLEHADNSIATLSLSAVCVGLAFITRYVGITLIITGLIAILVYVDGNKRKRITDCLFFGLISSLPMLLWMGRNWLMEREATSRQLVFHPISMTKIQNGIQVLFEWFFIPDSYPFISLIVLLILAVLYIVTVKYNRFTRHNRTTEICFIFIFTYIAFLMVSISYFDAHTPLDARILFPVYLFFILGLLLLSHRIYHTKFIKVVSYAIFLLMILLSFAQLGHQRWYLSYANSQGIGFANKIWVQSETLGWVKALPVNTTIYTNGPDVIKIHTGRSSKMIPKLVDPGNRIKNDNIDHEIKLMAIDLAEKGGVIVYLKSVDWRWYLPTINQLGQVLPLQDVFNGQDGVAVQLNQGQKEDFRNAGKISQH